MYALFIHIIFLTYNFLHKVIFLLFNLSLNPPLNPENDESTYLFFRIRAIAPFCFCLYALVKNQDFPMPLQELRDSAKRK